MTTDSKVKAGRLVIAAVVILSAGAALVFSGAVSLPHGLEKAIGKKADAKAPEKPAAAPAPARIAVTVAPLAVRAVQRTVEVVGTLAGLDDVDIIPKVQGSVVTLYRDVGDVVRPGDLLLELDPIDYQLAVDEAKRAAQAELAKLGLTEMPQGDIDIDRLPTVVRARNQEDNILRKLKRTEQLRQNNMLTQEDFEQVSTDYRVAQATRQVAEMDARSTLATARHKMALLATAEQRLRDTRVVAPLPTKATATDPSQVRYVVAERRVSEGAMVRPVAGTTVFRLVIDEAMKFQAPVPERYVGDVKLDQAVQIRVDAYPEKVFEGRVSRVSPVVDRLSRTFQVEVLVPNRERQLKTGGFAKAAILTRIDPKARTVPIEALVTSVGVTKLFLAQGDRAKAIEVTPGLFGAGWAEVGGPLPAEAQVITSGHEQLVDGSLIRIRTGEADQSAPRAAAASEKPTR